MASTFRSLLEIITKLPTTLDQLISQSPASTSSSSSGYAQLVGHLEKLRRRVQRILALLEDAEDREIRERRIKHWLDELRDVAYDAEDVIGEFEYELLRYQLACEEEQQDSIRNDEETQILYRGRKVSDSDVPPPCIPLHDVSFQQQILAEIKKINDRFDEIYEDGQKLGLHEEVGQRCSAIDVFEAKRTPSSSLVNEQDIRGRDVDKDKLMGMLLMSGAGGDDGKDGSHCDEGVRVLSVVGMGGLGKTTLAQLVYNDSVVREHFNIKAWVCVSEPFDVVRLTREILQQEEIAGQSGPGESEMTNFDSLQTCLFKKIQGKRFLLVLDDVWNEKQEHWDALWVCLSKGAGGSRVLITTRNEQVSRICRVSEPNMYKPGCLSPEDSWSLFEVRAFGGKKSDDHPNLVTLGRQIVEKCEGLPLALKTLSGLLCGNLTEEKWEDILGSELWELPEGENHILPALKLSYHHLPSPLKPCFVYCAVFPKDHEFDKDSLVFMWMAQGYIQPNRRRPMEDVGGAYFEELVQRSLFERTPLGGRIVMHDLIHDLALSILVGESRSVEDVKLAVGKARHLLLESEEDMEEGHLPLGATYLKRMRTALVRPMRRGDCHELIQKAVVHISSSMKCLRVLDLGGVAIDELPVSVCCLKHLRYLSIGSSRQLFRLPESLGDLLNLQTLCLKYCKIKELPQQLTRLVNLRHLLLDFTTDLTDLGMMPRGIGRLTKLQTLPIFVVGAEETGPAAGIEELSRLNDLQGELTIDFMRRPNNNVQHGDGGEAYILRNKPDLHALNMCFQYERSDDWKPQQHDEEELIENLQPHTNLRKLSIIGYNGSRLPEWLGDPSYRRLVTLNMYSCGDVRHLSALGRLPSLRSLHVFEIDTAGELFEDGMVVDEASFFPSLEELDLEYLCQCEGVSVGGEKGRAFPRLERLKISDCGKLKHVKLRQLTALETLEVRKCEELTMLDVPVVTFPQGEPSSPSLLHCEGVSVGGEKGGALPCLKQLTICECHKLEHVKLRQLTALETLNVSRCQELTTLDVVQHMQVPIVTSPQGDPSSSSSSELTRRPPPDQGSDINSCYNHIPNIHDITLLVCPKLKPLSAHVQQLLPPSIKKLDVSGSPLLTGWVARLWDSLVNLPRLLVDDVHLLLRNVEDVKEASTYQDFLLEKPEFSVRNVELRWDVEHQRVTFSAEEAERVLKNLMPNPCLGELVIRGYRGRSFPSWVGRPHFSCLSRMTLTGCLRCEHLPRLGVLPALKQLHISNMGEVRRVGRELCGSSRGGFPSLRTLEFHDMPKWEEWKGAENDVVVFPSLLLLKIYNCPRLKPFKLAALRQTELESDKSWRDCFVA